LLAQAMLVEGTGRRVCAVDSHAGMTSSGLAPDARQLLSRLRDEVRFPVAAFAGAAPRPRTAAHARRRAARACRRARTARRLASPRRRACSPTGWARLRT
jgi:20S proteasome alpha/beta subunit